MSKQVEWEFSVQFVALAFIAFVTVIGFAGLCISEYFQGRSIERCIETTKDVQACKELFRK